MKIGRYDEFQLANRHRIAFQTMGIMLALIFVNGLYKDSYGIWASPILEAAVLINIPILYFAIMTVAKNAYLSKEDNPIFILVGLGIALVFGLFTIMPFIFDGAFTIVEDGKLGGQIIGLWITLFTGGILTTLLIRKMLDRRKVSEED